MSYHIKEYILIYSVSQCLSIWENILIYKNEGQLKVMNKFVLFNSTR